MFGKGLGPGEPDKVLFVPDGRDKNPYQTNLARGLGEQDLDVVFAPGEGILPLLTPVFREKPDVLHLHWTARFVAHESKLVTWLISARFLFELWILRALGPPIVWTVHNVLDHADRAPDNERRGKRALLFFLDGLIVHCSAALNRLQDELGPLPDSLDTVEAIPHGHYLDNYPRPLPKTKARRELGLPEAETVFLFFGNLRPYKGVQELLEAFSQLDAENCHLLIAGSGANTELAAAVEEMTIRDPRVQAELAFVPDEELPVYFGAADCVVLPFREVTTSGSILLAMGQGCAVVAPRLGCIPEVLAHQDQLLYEQPNTADLLAALRTAMGQELSQIGEQNKQEARRLDWRSIGQRTRRVYEEVSN